MADVIHSGVDWAHHLQRNLNPCVVPKLVAQKDGIMILHFYFARRFAMTFALLSTVFFVLIFIFDLIEQTRLFAELGATLRARLLLTLLNAPATLNQILADTPAKAKKEGWIFGLGHEAALKALESSRTAEL